MNRRQFGGALVTGGAVALIGLDTFMLEGCTLASALTEADNILKLIAPLGDGVAAIVEVVDPGIAVAVSAAAKIYDAAATAVENFLDDWAAASAAAQPGILAQAYAALQTLQQDAASLIAAAQVKASAAASTIAAIFSTVIAEISALLTIIPQIGAMGGTTAALARVAHNGRVSLYGHESAKWHRSHLVGILNVSTGTAVDAPAHALATQLSALPLK